MELTGKVIAILPARSGVSQKSGNPWMSLQFVVEVPGQYPKKVLFDIFGEERIKQANINLNDDVNVSFDIDAHEFNGRWFNEIRAYSVVKMNQPQPAPQPAHQRPIPTRPVPQTPQMFPDNIQSNNDDDLPF